MDEEKAKGLMESLLPEVTATGVAEIVACRREWVASIWVGSVD